VPRRPLAVVAVCLAAAAHGACRRAPATPQPAGEATPPQAAPPRAAGSGQSPENQARNDSTMRAVLERIGGRSEAPAESVFRNVQWLKGIPARQFLSIMNGGYAAALGVTCSHCHVEGNFASDDKRPKRAARQMAVMHRSINTQLREMSELASTPAERRAINCATCHRGMINPMAGR
jgi:hypothetical protein